MLPKSFENLKKLDVQKIQKIWEKLFNENIPNFATIPYRLIWYKIQVSQTNESIEQRHLLRLQRYSRNPEEYVDKANKTKYTLKPGSLIIKTYKDKKHTVKIISNNQFQYNDQIFRTLSAVAMKICGKKVSGYDFFGLDNKRVNHLTSDPNRAYRIRNIR